MSLNSWKERSRALLEPIVGVLANLGVSPTAVTLFGLLLHVWSAVVIGRGNALGGGLILIVASICDALDGSLARETGKMSRFGAFLDSTVDRIEETLVLSGIAAYFIVTSDDGWSSFWPGATALALGGSLITSYARARAEGLGLECKIGLFERPERIVVTVVGLLLGWWFLKLAVLVLLILSWITVVQRILHVQLQLREVPGPLPDPPHRAVEAPEPPPDPEPNRDPAPPSRPEPSHEPEPRTGPEETPPERQD